MQSSLFALNKYLVLGFISMFDLTVKLENACNIQIQPVAVNHANTWK